MRLNWLGLSEEKLKKELPSISLRLNKINFLVSAGTHLVHTYVHRIPGTSTSGSLQTAILGVCTLFSWNQYRWISLKLSLVSVYHLPGKSIGRYI
jgi:hypothetical protein